jgi:hypothetical protein
MVECTGNNEVIIQSWNAVPVLASVTWKQKNATLVVARVGDDEDAHHEETISAGFRPEEPLLQGTQWAESRVHTAVDNFHLFVVF